MPKYDLYEELQRDARRKEKIRDEATRLYALRMDWGVPKDENDVLYTKDVERLSEAEENKEEPQQEKTRWLLLRKGSS